jgi:ornithine cyclodeaminase/alanine dehydrogenase-like protein (mu-crystallin family)
LLGSPQSGRSTDEQITLVDLTGIAAQDIAIASSILDAHAK